METSALVKKMGRDYPIIVMTILQGILKKVLERKCVH